MARAVTYLGYARSGQEFTTEKALEALGLQVWCGRVLNHIYRRKAKKWDSEVCPALENYLFITMDDEQFHMLKHVMVERPKWAIPAANYDDDPLVYSVKGMAPVLAPLSQAPEGHKGQSDQQGFEAFRSMIDMAYGAACERVERTKRPEVNYSVGQALEIVGGPFATLVGEFRGLEEDNGEWKLRVEPDIFGGRTPVFLSGSDVRAA